MIKIHMYVLIKKVGYNMEMIKHSEIQTIEDYKLYKKYISKCWYEANKEKKKQYQRDRYYNVKKNKSELEKK